MPKYETHCHDIYNLPHQQMLLKRNGDISRFVDKEDTIVHASETQYQYKHILDNMFCILLNVDVTNFILVYLNQVLLITCFVFI